MLKCILSSTSYCNIYRKLLNCRCKVENLGQGAVTSRLIKKKLNSLNLFFFKWERVDVTTREFVSFVSS